MSLPEEKYTLINDLELLSLYKSNRDNTIVGVLYKRYTLMCFGVAKKYLEDEEKAKDTVMHVFEKLLNNLSTYQIENFKSWLHSVVKNDCLMQIRKERPIELISVEKEKNIYASVENENFMHQAKEEIVENKIQEMEQAIQLLNEEQKICIDLFYIKSKSYAEVAEITGYNLNQVKSNIQNGKRNLKLKLQGNHEK